MKKKARFKDPDDQKLANELEGEGIGRVIDPSEPRRLRAIQQIMHLPSWEHERRVAHAKETAHRLAGAPLEEIQRVILKISKKIINRFSEELVQHGYWNDHDARP